MKVIKLAIFFFIFSTLQGVAQQAPPDTTEGPAPRISIQPRDWDYGYLPKGVSVSHIYTIKNEGDDTLRITNVRPSCGCTSAPLSKNVLAPGESVDLKVNFNSQNFLGQVTKTVHIQSNDQSAPYSTISFSAKIAQASPLVSWVPGEVVYDSLPQGRNDTRKVLITSNDTENLKITPVELPKEFVNVELKKQGLKPKQTGEVIFRLKKDVPVGAFAECATFEMTGTQTSRFTIPIRGKIYNK